VEIHSGVAKALENRDEDELKSWVDEHLDYLKERFLGHIEDKKDGKGDNHQSQN